MYSRNGLENLKSVQPQWLRKFKNCTAPVPFLGNQILNPFRVINRLETSSGNGIGTVMSISRNGTERNAGLFHGTGKCDLGTINLILEYLTWNKELDGRGTVNLILLE